MRSTPVRRATTFANEGAPPAPSIKAVERRLTALDEQRHDRTRVLPRSMATTPLLLLTEGDAEAFRHLAHSIVSRTLAHECEFRQLGSPEPDSKEWKLLKRREDLSVYRLRKPDPCMSKKASKTFTVKCVGTVDGMLEDVLYGMHAKDRDEMHATAAYLHEKLLDCAVLNVLDHGSSDDPFRQLALKWCLSETFGGARLVKQRDWFNLEATGMGLDARGRRYGYFLTKFIDHPACLAVPEESDVVRGKMAMCCIYRQQTGAKTIDVYAKGSIDLGGGLPAFLTSNASCAMMFSMALSVESAEGKRLTKLALQYADKRQAKGVEGKGRSATEFELELSYNDTTDSSLDLIAASFHSSTILGASSHELLLSPRMARRVMCHVCDRKQPAMSKLVRSSHRRCGICYEPTCSKCNLKRKLYGKDGAVAVLCCKICILESKRIEIDPRDPCPILPMN